MGDARTTSHYPPRDLNLITGPSSNTDMGGSYVRGAKGPRHLDIVLVKGRVGAPTCVLDQAALVTGEASGIGFATAAMLGRGGACVAVNVLPDDPSAIEACGRH